MTIAALFVPPPDPAILGRLASVLGPHNEAEERPNGLYAVCDDLLASEAEKVLETLRVFPEIPVAPHQGMRSSAEQPVQQEHASVVA